MCSDLLGDDAVASGVGVNRVREGDHRVLDPGAGRPSDMGPGEVLSIEVAPVDAVVRGPVRVLKIDTQGSEWFALQGARRLLAESPALALFLELWPYALRGARPEELLAFLDAQGFTLGKATAAPYPMTPERILRQVRARDPLRGGIDLYGTRALPFHVLGSARRLRGVVRSWREG
jgi:hypothetical protein